MSIPNATTQQFGSQVKVRRRAALLLKEHTPVEQLQRCAGCTALVPLLVDDGPLCIACDALHFPAVEPVRRRVA
jgi:hypothetical protein